MAKKTAKQPKLAERAVDLRTFTDDFFTTLGATVKTADRRKTGTLQVDLPPALATYFGDPSLTLCFQQAATSEGATNGQATAAPQLIAHGSPLFDKMLAYLENKSAVTHQRLPARHNAGEELMRALRPANTGIVGLKMQEQTHHLYAFHWHITYRADDKHEELYSVLLNEAGERLLNQDGDSAINATALTTLLADAEPLPPEPVSPDGQPQPSRLPPMTQLHRLAEIARKYAIYHADVRCVSHEAEILPRLYKTLNRLTTYYQQQIEEVYDAHDPTGEKRRALEVDLERKLAEEVENHRLRVQVQLFSYAVLQVPVAMANLTLSDGKREVAVQVLRNRYDGSLQRPHCHVCHNEMTQVVLDRNGHLVCDNCFAQCSSCQDLLCTTCAVAICPVCNKANCDTCGRLCWACGERACADHSSLCPICGDEVCHACQETCSHCGVRQCRSHLRIDQVKVTAGETAYICNECAVRCPGCEQYSAQVGACSASGQRFCQNCLVGCSTCQRTVGLGFYETIDHKPYCHECLVECPSCQRWALTVDPCPQCQTDFCASCGAACTVCQQRFCPDHSFHYAGCDHVVCTNHTAHCNQCQDELCPLCNVACAICEQYACDLHQATCKQCGQLYCRNCISNGLCTTCTVLTTAPATESDIIDLSKEPCSADSRVAKLLPHYTWTRARNQRYTLYLGRAPQRRDAFIVAAGDNRAEVLSAKGQSTAQARQQNADQPQSREAGDWLREFQDWLRRMRRSGRGR